MNKTVNINLAGMVFHIDEDAYNKLHSYIEQLRKHFRNEESSEEIILDIEARIAELFQERLQNREAVSLEDVSDIISIMGEAEQYTEDSGSDSDSDSNKDEQDLRAGKRRRIFRDGEDRMVGGVCAGLSNYFDIDSLWLRIIFILFLFVGGGFLLYIILWMVIPEAKTTAEKLEMKGEKVNISNIEKNIKKEFDKVERTIDNISNHPQTKKVSKKAQNISKKITDLIVSLFNGVAALIISLMGFSAIVVGIIFIMVLSGIFFSEGVSTTSINANIFSYLLEDDPASNTFLVGSILFLIIPIISVVLLGFRILAGTRVTKNTKIGMLALWIVGIVLIGYGANEKGDVFGHHALHLDIENINSTSDTLYVEGFNSKKKVNISIGTSNTLADSLMITGFVDFDIKQHDKQAQLHVLKKAFSENSDKARTLAEDVVYHSEAEENYLTLPNHFYLPKGSKWRMQDLTVTLKIPEGKVVFLDQSLKEIIYDIDNTEDMWDMDMLGHYWKMEKEGLSCISCEDE